MKVFLNKIKDNKLYDKIINKLGLSVSVPLKRVDLNTLRGQRKVAAIQSLAAAEAEAKQREIELLKEAQAQAPSQVIFSPSPSQKQ